MNRKKEKVVKPLIKRWTSTLTALSNDSTQEDQEALEELVTLIETYAEEAENNKMGSKDIEKW